MEKLDKFTNQIIDVYESTLALEGDEISKEIESLFTDNFELIIVKARSYCEVCLGSEKNSIDTDLYRKCKKYLDQLNFYYNFKKFLRIEKHQHDSS